ncbi:sigma-70 family RNA polymerase sigma factor [Candidatus Poribacteria bacterium]|nr:sigma-70 family RNA polymerase sigma factor [Candidatus Poribacteria bacterium]MYA56590.1 sigma-70 family RNA polymerase sigma factor [Candidatus Poribacteria bacterium]
MAQKDAQLIQRVLQGDQESFSPLVRKYQKGVHALVWRKIGDFHIAQEITQDAFLTAYKKLRTLKNHNQFAGWLYVIAANLCRDYLRRKRLPMESLDADNTNEVDKVSYSQYVADKQKTDADETRRETVKELLKKLPESERTVMTLHYLGEMTIQAIAEFLGVSPNTVKSRLSRARNRLRKEEDVIQQNLGSFQLPDTFADNIMQEVSRIAPVPPAVSKPVAPLAISAASAILIFLMMGVGTQYLSRFQRPYNLDATSEPTVEIIDAVFVYDSPAKPAVRSQAGSSALPGKSPGAGQKPDDSLVATLPIDTTEVSTSKPQWRQTRGPEGGSVQNLSITSNGDSYARTGTDLYRLADDGSRWSIVNTNMPVSGSWQMTEHDKTPYVVSDTEVLTSIDRGETWHALGARPEGQLVDLVITDGSPGTHTDIVMYLGLVNGVFSSVDTGKSWTPASDPLMDKEIRVITAIEDVVFVGTDSGLYRLNSAGWMLLPVDEDHETRNVRALANAGHRLYVAVGDKVVNKDFELMVPSKMVWETSLPLYRSTDLGDTWQTLDYGKVETEPSLPVSMTIRVGAGDLNSDPNGKEHPKNAETKPTLIFKMIAVEDNLLILDDRNSYYSSDAGDTWVPLNSSIPNIADVSTLVSSDANTFYRNGESGIYRTTDAGKTWHPFNPGLVKTAVMHLVSVQNVLYANVGGTLLTSSDAGESWTPVPSSLGNIINLVRFNDLLYARGVDETRPHPRLFHLSTEDNRLTPVPDMPFLVGRNYTKLIEERFMEIFQGTDEAEGEKNTLEDLDAEAFVEDYSPVLEELIVEILTSLVGNFAVGGDAYYMEFEQRLFRWKPGTTEWVDTGLINKFPVDSLDRANTADSLPSNLAASENTVYIGTWDGRLFQSFDEGNTWNDVMESLPFPVADFNAITFAGSTLYVATDSGVVYANDGDLDWHTTTDTEGIPIVIERFAVDGTTLYGTSEQQVYRFKEGTGVWQQVAPEIPMPITSLAVEGNVLYVGTRGSGVLRFTLDESE